MKKQLLLTPRQTEVRALALEGLMNKQIAERLGIKPGTVKLHLQAGRLRMGPIPSRRSSARPRPWKRYWDLSTIPDADLIEEAGKRWPGISMPSD